MRVGQVPAGVAGAPHLVPVGGAGHVELTKEVGKFGGAALHGGGAGASVPRGDARGAFIPVRGILALYDAMPRYGKPRGDSERRRSWRLRDGILVFFPGLVLRTH